MLALQDGRSGSFVLLDLQKNQVDSLKGCKTIGLTLLFNSVGGQVCGLNQHTGINWTILRNTLEIRYLVVFQVFVDGILAFL